MCKRFADDRCWSVGYFKPTSLFFQGKCKFEWDKLYDMFLQCDGDWMQCCLVTESTSAHGHERLGRWKSFTKQESISWNPMCCFVISCDPKSFCTRILERTSCASTKMRLQFWISSPVRLRMACGNPIQIFRMLRTHQYSICIYTLKFYDLESSFD